MTLASIRAHIETRVNTAFSALVPAVPVVYDNVNETPPDLPYVVCLISYLDTTIPTVCVTDGRWSKSTAICSCRFTSHEGKAWVRWSCIAPQP